MNNNKPPQFQQDINNLINSPYTDAVTRMGVDYT